MQDPRKAHARLTGSGVRTHHRFPGFLAIFGCRWVFFQLPIVLCQGHGGRQCVDFVIDNLHKPKPHSNPKGLGVNSWAAQDLTPNPNAMKIYEGFCSFWHFRHFAMLDLVKYLMGTADPASRP